MNIIYLISIPQRTVIYAKTAEGIYVRIFKNELNPIAPNSIFMSCIKRKLIDAPQNINPSYFSINKLKHVRKHSHKHKHKHIYPILFVYICKTSGDKEVACYVMRKTRSSTHHSELL